MEQGRDSWGRNNPKKEKNIIIFSLRKKNSRSFGLVSIAAHPPGGKRKRHEPIPTSSDSKTPKYLTSTFRA
jgi:hypothetical protein